MFMWGRLSTCPTNSAEFPAPGKLSGLAHECVRHVGIPGLFTGSNARGLGRGRDPKEVVAGNRTSLGG